MGRRYQLGDEPIPGFRLAGFLGRGSFGEVWKADAPGGTQVAMKIIDLLGRPGLKEFRALRRVRRIRHPNLVPIMAYWVRDEDGRVVEAEEDEPGKSGHSGSASRASKGRTADARGDHEGTELSELIVVMGLGDRNLADRLDECTKAGLTGIPLDELIEYMEATASALDFLNSPRHNLGQGPVAIQHCDIKPQNILLVGGAVQVCDLGVAKALDDARTTTATGTAAYGAPEILRGSNPSSHTDQYSLAITYYELRTGSLPFDDESLMGVMTAHLDGRLNLSRLSDAERDVVGRAASLEPARRYASCREFMADLRRAVGAPEPSRTTVPAPPPRPRWFLASAMTLAALAALAALGAILMDGVGTIEARLPPGFKAAASGRPVDVHGVPLFDRIVPDKPGLDRAVFLLVPKNEEHPDNPRTFYIMENKVTVGLYRMFASESGQSSDGAAWEPRSAPPDVDDPLPVMSVRVTEAQAFAAWIAGPIGFLPSIEQWNKAAGHCPQDRGSRVGPFRSGFSPDDEHAIGINRGDKGPLPAGSATHDVAEPYGCRDMAGNGFEWTRNIAYAEGDSTIPLAVDPIPFTQVVVRGKSFAGSGMEPLTYEDLEPTAPPEANNYFEGDPFTGFRVVLDWPE